MSAPRLPTKTIPVPFSDSASLAAVIDVPSCGTSSGAVVACRGRSKAHAGDSQYHFARSGGDFRSCICERGDELRNSLRRLIVVMGASALIVVFPGTPQSANAEQPTYDITTLAGKVASVNGTAGLQIRFSSFIEQEAAEEDSATAAAPITPGHVLSSPLDGTSVAAPAVTVNRDTAGAPQNDPALAFDSRGRVYYAGLGFNRASPPNTVAVNRGTFDASGKLTWGAPSFINQTTSPSTLNDKEWIAADTHPTSPFRDRVYVTWTRFIFSAGKGNYVQSPIFFASSSDGGATFSAPTNIVGNVHYDQGSRPVVGPDGSVFVFFEGSTRFAQLNSTYVVKSTDGGATWGAPIAVSTVSDIISPANTVFRVNSFPAAGAAPNGDLYVAWSSMMSNQGGLCPGRTNIGCHAASLYSKSTDGGATWSAPALVLPSVDASTRTALGYPVTQPAPDGSTLNAP